jgi:hypothetical protein
VVSAPSAILALVGQRDRRLEAPTARPWRDEQQPQPCACSSSIALVWGSIREALPSQVVAKRVKATLMFVADVSPATGDGG